VVDPLDAPPRPLIRVETIDRATNESEPDVDRGQTSSATSARKIGPNSRSNHGLRFNQPVLRHEGCGKGSLLGPAPVS
jgi:hypothetical protein